MEFTDYYAVLGVARTADQSAIRDAYRRLARKLHPDVNKDPAAEQRFKKVNEAYDVLGDPEKRAKYDRLGADWERLDQFERAGGSARRPAGAGRRPPRQYSDFFETFFGDGGLDLDDLFRRDAAPGGSTRSRSAGPERGADIEETVDITLEEAMNGGGRRLTVGERSVEVRIPPGVAEGSRVRVAGEGRPGRGGGASGDIYLRVHILPHPRFTPRGRDLAADLEVRDHQAVLGAEIRLAGPAGPLTVTVPPGTQAGQVLRLRGKGIPALSRAVAGDLLLTVVITAPAAPVPEAERRLYERLAQLREGASAGAAEAGAAPG